SGRVRMFASAYPIGGRNASGPGRNMLCITRGSPMGAPPADPTAPAADREASSLRDLSGRQWKSGIAAWLGWLFDGLDMHLYVLVATPFVAELLRTENLKDPQVKLTSSYI